MQQHAQPWPVGFILLVLTCPLRVTSIPPWLCWGYHSLSLHAPPLAAPAPWQAIALSWSHTCPRYHESQQLFRYIMFARTLRFWLRLRQRQHQAQRRRRAARQHVLDGHGPDSSTPVPQDGLAEPRAGDGTLLPGPTLPAPPFKRTPAGPGPPFTPDLDDTSSLGRRALQQLKHNRPLLPYVRAELVSPLPCALDTSGAHVQV